MGIVGDGLVVSGVEEEGEAGDLEGEADGEEERAPSATTAVGGVTFLMGVTKAEGEVEGETEGSLG